MAGHTSPALNYNLDGLPLNGLAIAAGQHRSPSGLLPHYYLISREGDLYYHSQDPNVTTEADPLKTGWAPMLKLAGGLSTAHPECLASATDHNGLSHAFAVGWDGSIHHVWKNTKTGSWESRQIHEESRNDRLVAQATYNTQITVVDDAQNPIPNAEVQISAEDYAVVNIGGKIYQLQPNRYQRFKTNANGFVQVIHGTRSIGAVALKLKADFMAPNDMLFIRPDRYIQAYLSPEDHTALRDDMARATSVQSGQPTFPNATSEDLDATAQAIAESLRLFRPADGDDTGPNAYLASGYARSSITLLQNGLESPSSRFNDSGPDSYRVSFKNGRVTFDIFDGAAPSAKSMAKSHWLPDWGDLWHSVKHGAHELAEYTVTKIRDAANAIVTGVEVVIHLVGIDTAFNYVVDTVKQAFDMAEALFHLLN
ncbi:MAG: hypothetical protein AAF570_25105, partial [Bacteroidota bacterium]